MGAVSDTPPPSYYWDGYDQDSGDEYLECCICTHSMTDECWIGEYDYFGPGQHACICCTQNEPDPNEEFGPDSAQDQLERGPQ